MPIDWVYNQSMTRPSVRERRRTEITRAFAKVLSEHGHEGATIAAVAAAAGVAPGLVHHHFESKADLVDSLLTELVARFRERTRGKESTGDPLAAYLSAAVELDASADQVAARCWVGLLAEAVRSPALGARVRRLVDGEIEAIRRRSGDTLSPQEAGAVLAFVVGALVLGAFAPRRIAGFAAAALRTLAKR
jgi:TetR/AcrR family transcriptional repressor of bet genes